MKYHKAVVIDEISIKSVIVVECVFIPPDYYLVIGMSVEVFLGGK